jgi:hypothetical protein
MTPLGDSRHDCFGRVMGAARRPPYEKCDKSPRVSIGSARFSEKFFRGRHIVRSARPTHCARGGYVFTERRVTVAPQPQCATALAHQASRHLLRIGAAGRIHVACQPDSLSRLAARG